MTCILHFAVCYPLLGSTALFAGNHFVCYAGLGESDGHCRETPFNAGSRFPRALDHCPSRREFSVISVIWSTALLSHRMPHGTVIASYDIIVHTLKLRLWLRDSCCWTYRNRRRFTFFVARWIVSQL